MCGIALQLSSRLSIVDERATGRPAPCSVDPLRGGDGEAFRRDIPDGPLRSMLTARGPDTCSLVAVHDRWSLAASTLHIRGSVPTRQPLVAGDGSVLAFNGEVLSADVVAGANDTALLARWLAACDGDAERIVQVMGALRGPWAFVYWHAATDRIWFGRDRLGRRSLLVSQYGGAFGVCSAGYATPPLAADRSPLQPMVVPDEALLDEVIPVGLYALQLPPPGSNATPWTLHPFPGRPTAAPLDRLLPPAQRLLATLSESVRRRVDCLDRRSPDEGAAPIGVLFSGGLDCTVLAALLDRHLQPRSAPIDLINFAFGADPMSAPDRQTAINAAIELRAIAPDRPWRLVEVDVGVGELAASAGRIRSLISPRNTVMDFNLGAVLWFAAQGAGVVVEAAARRDRIVSPQCRYGDDSGAAVVVAAPGASPGVAAFAYRSRCRLLLSGLGADELFAGYGRHRTAFQHGGVDAVRRELDLDLERLWRRNLGRDDRLCSDSGREVLYPFLDADVVDLCTAMSVDQICRLDEPIGVGDKKVLREAARSLGLAWTSRLVKRAIQFGTRIANRRVNGKVLLDEHVHLLHIVQQERADRTRPSCV